MTLGNEPYYDPTVRFQSVDGRATSLLATLGGITGQQIERLATVTELIGRIGSSSPVDCSVSQECAVREVGLVSLRWQDYGGSPGYLETDGPNDS